MSDTNGNEDELHLAISALPSTDSSKSINKLARSELSSLQIPTYKVRAEMEDTELLTSPLTGIKIQSKHKVEGRIDQKLEVCGSVFSGRDEKEILKQRKKDQQNEIRMALEQQILEKKLIKDKEKLRRLENEKEEELRIQNEINQELKDTNMIDDSKKYTKGITFGSQDSNFMQSKYQANLVNKPLKNPEEETSKMLYTNNPEDKQETPSLSEVKASDINDEPEEKERIHKLTKLVAHLKEEQISLMQKI